MKKILVATDFSACAGNAMEYAMKLGKTLNMEVCALHAIGSTEGVFNNTYNAIYIEDYYNNKREALTAWVASYKTGDLADVPTSTVCEVGSLHNVLTKYISENSIELIAMGTMGSTGIAGLFGSNASMVVEKIKTPTLVLPLESKFATNPSITLATDFASNLSTEDVNALNELLVALDPKKMNVLNIVEGGEWKTNETGESKLRELIKVNELDFKYISESNPTEGIMNFIISSGTDILCVVKHHHNLIYRIFNKSTVSQVMNKSIKAILVLHE